MHRTRWRGRTGPRPQCRRWTGPAPAIVLGAQWDILAANASAGVLFDLVGLAVCNLEGVALGRVESVTSNGAQDVLVIQDGDTERLIPFVHGPIIQSVSLSDGVIVEMAEVVLLQ